MPMLRSEKFFGALYNKLYQRYKKLLSDSHLNKQLLKRIFLIDSTTISRQEGKTYDEAAQILGISKHAVKEHMTAAMKSIKKYLRQNADIVFSLLIVELVK
jgi:DNA-directed RNA polymerase sigma subunit (sigma70/sigma32)